MMDTFYRAFEDCYRGSREVIKSRLRQYLPFIVPLASKHPGASAFDVGCGRGEWLELMAEINLAPYGVDLDDGMLEACVKLELPAHKGDAIAHLSRLPNDSQIAVSAFHVVEHLSFEQLQTLVCEALRVLKCGGLLIMETPNPENISVATRNFYLDPTHQRPIPPQLLSFLPEYYGFAQVKILRLQESAELATGQQPLSLLGVINGVSPDYAVVAQKGGDEVAIAATKPAFDTEYGLTLEVLVDRYEAQAEAVAHQSEARAAQAEAVAQQAEARAVQAEAVAQQAEARATQAEVVAHQSEARAAQAEAVAHQSESRAAQAEVVAHQSEARAAQAEAVAHQSESRAAQAEAVAHQSEARAAQVEAVAQQAEARATQAEAVAQQAEARAAQAEAVAQQALARAAQTDAVAQQAESRAAQAEAVAQQSESRAAQAEAVAQQRNHELQTVYASRSWRVTAPLRFIICSVRWLVGGAWAWLTLKPGSRPRRIAKRIIRRGIAAIEARPGLKQRIVARSHRLGLYLALRRLYQRIVGKSMSIPQYVAPSGHAPGGVATGEGMTPWTRHMASRLDAARAGMKREVK